MEHTAVVEGEMGRPRRAYTVQTCFPLITALHNWCFVVAVVAKLCYIQYGLYNCTHTKKIMVRAVRSLVRQWFFETVRKTR